MRWLLPFLLTACGGQGCNGCSGLPASKTVPNALVLPVPVQLRLTQHGFDVISQDILAILKTLFATAPAGQVQIDVDKFLGSQPIALSGGLGLFIGKASVRDLVLTLDLKSLSVKLVDPSNPARIRITVDHARIGVLQGVVTGEAEVLGFKSDAGCHLLNGIAAGSKDARLGTVSATLDLVLGVDAAGKLAISAQVSKPVLHELGFALGKDCNLPECTDQALVEPPCLECELCATGQLASDALQTLKAVLEPVLGQLLEVVGNLLIPQLLAQSLNGKPLDLELPLDIGAQLATAAPQFAGVLGTGNPLWLRARPAGKAFVVEQGGLHARFDAAAFAAAHECVANSGKDDTPVFAQLPQAPPPPLPQAMTAWDSNGKAQSQVVDAGVLLAPAIVEEAVWAAARSGLLCMQVDSARLWSLSGGKVALTAGLLDVALPGLRRLAGPNAPLRLDVVPVARPEDAPLTVAQPAPDGATRLHLQLRGLELRLAAQVRGRWLTLLELRADAKAVLRVKVVGGKLELAVDALETDNVAVSDPGVLKHAQPELLVPAAASLGVALLFAQPLQFDLDVQQAVQQVIALPVALDVVGLQAQPGGWLALGVTIASKAGAP
jgi:hypothetical protein